jgi:hypothetical protein
MVLVYWSLAFVIGSAIPQVQTISGLVAAVCIMQVRASLSFPHPLNCRSSRTRSRSCSRGGTCTASAARPRCPRRCKRSSGRTSCCSSPRSRWRASACTAPGPRSRRRSRRARRRASGVRRPSEMGASFGDRWMAGGVLWLRSSLLCFSPAMCSIFLWSKALQVLSGGRRTKRFRKRWCRTGTDGRGQELGGN